MADIKSLVSRVDAEFSALREKYKKGQAEQVHTYQERQQRLQQLGKVFDRLREIWGPRLEVLVKKFGDEVQVTPRIVPSTREAKFEFQSKLARINLRLSASTDRQGKRIKKRLVFRGGSSDTRISPTLSLLCPRELLPMCEITSPGSQAFFGHPLSLNADEPCPF